MSRIGPHLSPRIGVTIGLVLLITLAGCAGLGPGSPSPTTVAPQQSTDQTTTEPPTSIGSPQPTATPTAQGSTPTTSPTTDDTTTTSVQATATKTELEATLPSGISRNGIENVSQVLSVHQSQLATRPGTVKTHTNATLGNRTVLADVTVNATSNLTRVRYEGRSQTRTPNETGNRTTILYGNETAVVQRVTVDGNVTLANTKNRSDVFDRALRGLATATNPLRGVLRRGEFTVTEVDQVHGTSVIVLQADAYSGGNLARAENVEQYEATVRVTANGTVLSASESVVGTTNSRTQHYRFSYEFTPQPVDPSPLNTDRT
jgi:hypothetical protein